MEEDLEVYVMHQGPLETIDRVRSRQWEFGYIREPC